MLLVWIRTMSDYNGWNNRGTWNVALWINNDESIYKGAVEFMKDYKGKQPYVDFLESCGLDTQKTPDGFEYVNEERDYEALNKMMMEFRGD